jgi:plasmid maintenance system antidote protein VapI
MQKAVFGATPEFWLNLQSLYKIGIARKKVGGSISRLPSPKHFAAADA